ncbi:MAG: serine/threonine-protein kinase [Polyangiaceae bacterium]
MTEVANGTLLAGKYRLESLIGRGGMGSVWRAEHLGLNAPVAVKLLDQVAFTGSAEALNRFHREARAAAAIRSPHVVQTFDHGVDETLGLPFIVMELMEGESLADRLAHRGPISPTEVAPIFTHVARALSRAHEAGIVHRDLKPDNVFLVRNEDEEIAKVLDFGIAKAQAHGLAGNSATVTGAVMGTAYYMSPEQISGAKVDLRTDLWALGVMACECLTGRRPFEADTIGGITLKICIEPIPRPSSFAMVPVGFDEWFVKIVNRDPAQRFTSARDAADALRLVCTGEVGGQRSSSPAAPDTGVPRASLPAFTVAPFSRSANDLARIPTSNPVRLLPWAGGAAAVVAVGIAVLLRHSAAPANQKQTAPSSSVVAAASSPASSLPAVTVLPVACEPNASQCLGTTPQTCVAGQWAAAPVTAGQCGAACTPESSPPRCISGIPQSCDQAGNWRANAPCSDAQECRAGECAPKKPASIAKQSPSLSASPAPRAAAAIRPNCDPSYTLDSQGQKHFKPECYR